MWAWHAEIHELTELDTAEVNYTVGLGSVKDRYWSMTTFSYRKSKGVGIELKTVINYGILFEEPREGASHLTWTYVQEDHLVLPEQSHLTAVLCP